MAKPRPQPPHLTYVTIPTEPTAETVKIITDLHSKGHEVVAISHLCGTAGGRRRVLLALRAAGLSPQLGASLGWSTFEVLKERLTGSPPEPSSPEPAPPAPAPAPRRSKGKPARRHKRADELEIESYRGASDPVKDD